MSNVRQRKKEKNEQETDSLGLSGQIQYVTQETLQKKEDHRVTYKSGGRCTQVDYVLCRRCNLKEIGDCKVLAGDSVARQHRMVVCRMALEVKKKKRRVWTERRIRWWKLKEEDCSVRFRDEVRQGLGGGEEVLGGWATTAEVMRETARKVLGVTSENRKEDKEMWCWNEVVQESIRSTAEKAYNRVERGVVVWYEKVRVVQDILALSPFLFAVVMDRLTDDIRQESPWTIMFVNDIVICGESREQVEKSLERWRYALERREYKSVELVMPYFIGIVDRIGKDPGPAVGPGPFTVTQGHLGFPKQQPLKDRSSVDDVTISKTITTRSNQKPWMTANVRALLKQRDSAFRTGDKAALKTARAKLSRAIREAKRAHAKKIHDHFQDSGDTRRMWQGIQVITNYKTTSPACDRDASLPDALNDFYARFEVQNNVVVRKTIPPPTDQVLCLTTAEVRKTLCRVNPRKSAGPDNIPGRVLRECAEQLADVFTDIFNISLSSNVVPTCLKTTTIVPVPKKSTVSCLNDYRPVALTPIVMKCFERLVMRHIKTQLPPSLDPMQFAYRPNRSTDDAISTTLHLALTHLDNKDSYVRMLFIDFSSAFNTIIPQHLIEKLNLLGLNTSLCNWILDFLTGRPQAVRIGNSISSTTTLSTGAPQGCVLSPLLFTLLTHDCAPTHSSNHIIKFADDTTVVGLISRNDESAYREEVQRLTAWCGANNLSLNVDKTKEMVVDFRRAQSDQSPLIIDGSSVEIVKSTKFLGVHLADNLTWSLNTSSITKKAQQRLYFLRRLRKAHLPPPILSMFYRGTIESILSSCITAWFGNCTVSDRKTLQRIVRTAEKIIGVSLPSIMDIYTTRCIRKAHSIVDDHTHPSHAYFTLLPSGKRFRSIRAVTTRLCNSFFPQAIRLLNTQN
ncbi:gastrula zinc finger protein XlCGF28.1-like [Silurus meridionalis]|nr:gastrula zinc finger protein XlCGF28.1-like [Silurus meridionalis]